MHGVEQFDRNILLLCGPDTGRVQNFCAEIGQLGGLIETQLFDRDRFLYNARVVVVDACMAAATSEAV